MPSQTLSRRSFMKLGVGALAALGVGGIINAIVLPRRPAVNYRATEDTYPFKLPALPYGVGALEPVISSETMRLHHDRHHQGYVNSLNTALQNYPSYHNMTVGALLAGITDLPEGIHNAVQRHGGGHYNHSLFWQWLAPGGSNEPVGEVAEAIGDTFGGTQGLKNEMLSAASSHFGSGWVWLVVTPTGELGVMTTANQDSPLMVGAPPILGIDLWEHAYYIDYRNQRSEYVESVWDIINWDVVDARYEEALMTLGSLGAHGAEAGEEHGEGH
jgi:Fe-Mn family superoxide dismutase